MIFFYLTAAVAGFIAYFVSSRLSRMARIIIAGLVFLIPSVGLTALVFAVGDRGGPSDVNVVFDEPANDVSP